MSVSNFTLPKVAAPVDPFKHGACREGEGRWTPGGSTVKASRVSDHLATGAANKGAPDSTPLAVLLAQGDPDAIFAELGLDQEVIISDALASRMQPAVRALAGGDFHAAMASMSNGLLIDGNMVDIGALVQHLIRESYIESTADLAHYAEKVRFITKQKQALRDYAAQLKQVRAQPQLAGVKDDDKATTTLNGNKKLDTSGASSATADGKRTAGTDAAIGVFTAYADKVTEGGETQLEKDLRSNPSLRKDLVAAIPQMSAAELKKVFLAVGGMDMKLPAELASLGDEIFAAMTDKQVAALENDTSLKTANGLGQKDTGWLIGEKATAFDSTQHEGSQGGRALGTLWAKKLEATKNRLEGSGSITDRLAAKEAANSKAAGSKELDDFIKTIGDKALTDTMRWVIEDSAKGAGGEDKTINNFYIRKLISSTHGGTEEQKKANIQKFVDKFSDKIGPSAKKLVESYQKGENWDTINKAGDWAADATYERSVRWDGEQGRADAIADGQQHERTAARIAVGAARDLAARDRAAQGGDLDASDGVISSFDLSLNSPELVANGKTIGTVKQLDTEIERIDEKLKNLGDDAQLANVDLQNMLQKQQQTLQTLSNVAKNRHDVAMAIIRNIGG